jgi:hypothetical protein
MDLYGIVLQDPAGTNLLVAGQPQRTQDNRGMKIHDEISVQAMPCYRFQHKLPRSTTPSSDIPVENSRYTRYAATFLVSLAWKLFV